MREETWKHVGTLKNYDVWVYLDGTKPVWNMTHITHGEPDSPAGYYSLEAVLKLHGVQI